MISKANISAIFKNFFFKMKDQDGYKEEPGLLGESAYLELKQCKLADPNPSTVFCTLIETLKKGISAESMAFLLRICYYCN